MSDPPVPLMRPQFAAFSTIVPAARHAPPARSGPLPALRSVKVLDQLRERIRYLHYSRRTEEAYVHWVRAFIRFHGLRHPLSWAGRRSRPSCPGWRRAPGRRSSTHKQALSALLFFYSKVLGVDLPWMDEIGRPRVQRAPAGGVVQRRGRHDAHGACDGEHRLFAQLLYGTGMRLVEGLQLRVKDVDFEHRAIIVRAGKGGKDRLVMLPESTRAAHCAKQLARAQGAVGADQAGRPRRRGHADALERKYPRAGSVLDLVLGLPAGHPFDGSAQWRGAPPSPVRPDASSARSSARCWRRVSRSRPRRTRCGMHLRRTCCSRATTSARCRSCWGMRTWPRR